MRRRSGSARPPPPTTPKARSLQSGLGRRVSDAQIDDAVSALRGEISQIPSAVSAVKIGGKRAYRLAREGEAVELPPAACASTGSTCWPSGARDGMVDVDVEVDCSSGTYIRALARDIGSALGVGGHLTALRRTRVGRFGLDEARTLEQLSEEPRLSYTLDQACLLAFPRRDLTVEETESARHGRALQPAGFDGVYAATAPDGHVIALLKDDGAQTKSVVVLRPATL